MAHTPSLKPALTSSINSDKLEFNETVQHSIYSNFSKQHCTEASGDADADRTAKPISLKCNVECGDENLPLDNSLEGSSDSFNADPAVKIIDVSGYSPLRKYLSVFVLFFINLLNYMDRYTIAGVLLSIQEYFGVKNSTAGLLQVVFIVSYMIVAPIFGYLGDRYNRKILMLIGMFIWSGCTLLASFVSNPSEFYYFLALRGLVGIGEASYSTIAPTIIADLFVKTRRTRMLSVFFFATPVGSGLGYIVGSAAAQIGGSWQWALRVTPALGVISMILLIFVLPNPPRGGNEADDKVANSVSQNHSSYLDDLKYVFTNFTFMWITIGFTCMAFVVGALALWGPEYVAYAQIVVGALHPCIEDDCNYPGVSFTFGLITCIAGFSGVWIGAESAKKWKDYGNKAADAHICAIGLIGSSPLLFGGFLWALSSIKLAWVCVFFGEMFLCFTWTLVTDMTLYVTLPMRRSTAQAVQILVMHLLGDAGSPYLVGVISDAIFAERDSDTFYGKYVALQIAFFTTLYIAVLGGACFLVASLNLQRDKKKVDDYLAGLHSSSTSTCTNTSSISEPSSPLIRHAEIEQSLTNQSKCKSPDEIPLLAEKLPEPESSLFPYLTVKSSPHQTENVRTIQRKISG